MTTAQDLFASIGRGLRRTVATAVLAAAALGAPALAQPAMWAVKDADSTIYMLGTVHLLRPETQWRSDALDKAIAEAKELWLELPTTDPQAMAGEMMPLVAKYGLSPATPLSKSLTGTVAVHRHGTDRRDLLALPTIVTLTPESTEPSALGTLTTTPSSRS